MELLGYIVCLLVGLSLGLIGAGGGILTVPVMVYLFHMPVLLATSYSLFVVGGVSLTGAWYQFRQQQVNLRVALLFCAVSMSIVFVVRHFVLPRIPDELFVLFGVPVTTSFCCMVLFAILMITAALAMIMKEPARDAAGGQQNTVHVLWCGLVVGLLTGFLGAGGGFILIPALVLFLGLPMKEAVGTSLFIIALNSLAGFALDLDHVTIEWPLLAGITVVAATGMFAGAALGRRVSTERLKHAFGWFVLVVGVAILIRELTGFIGQ
ncbi:sulfite exporter TauE/SafE family protein [Flavihumibacter petaseus]|uniref:Probable membrane transporter protein n=1 Tax=Flavihumibacter petaseus NBRC 106054 TaxID=1220578 RepID=A0A0E9N090_9BACT|nr:sulfite exporter TauE/SafE family protein [Flavihumibacter petaseus]GAO43041.1 hypothetical protein FPE01S_02_01460 [Flavihumibacter petaseus NBRC 106054]